MKQIIFLILLLGSFFNSTTSGVDYVEVQDVLPFNDAAHKLRLDGKFKSAAGDLRSGTDPIVVEKIGRILYVTFQEDLSIMNVTIQGPRGVEYASSVDTSNAFTLTVPLNNCPSGNYTISFTNQYGAMQGTFTL